LCGFSFGGRVALAIAAERPEKVRRIVCTGVPSNRGATGRIILQSWLKSLSRGDLEEFLWQSMSDGHSQTFLNRHESRLYGWVKAAAESNRTEAIKGLVGQTHTDDLNDPWHTVNLANRALKGGLGEEDALFLVGDQDRLATVEQCNALAELGGWRCETIYGSGHALPIEQPVKWRSAVMAHFASN
jgi:pimeloyl-ACP methyl ester carboxylesterase